MTTLERGPLLRATSVVAHRHHSDPRRVLDGLDLTIHGGEVVTVSGSDAAALSAVGAVMMGSCGGVLSGGTIFFDGDDVTGWPTDERAKSGMFLVPGTTPVVPGVSVVDLLVQALSANGKGRPIRELRQTMSDWVRRLDLDPDLADRTEYGSVTQQLGAEMLQLAVLEPQLAMVDATRLDDDRETSDLLVGWITEIRREYDSMSMMIATDSDRFACALSVDRVLVLEGGRIAELAGTIPSVFDDIRVGV